jgi:hypothetical protein
MDIIRHLDAYTFEKIFAYVLHYKYSLVLDELKQKCKPHKYFERFVRGNALRCRYETLNNYFKRNEQEINTSRLRKSWTIRQKIIKHIKCNEKNVDYGQNCTKYEMIVYFPLDKIHIKSHHDYYIKQPFSLLINNVPTIEQYSKLYKMTEMYEHGCSICFAGCPCHQLREFCPYP